MNHFPLKTLNKKIPYEYTQNYHKRYKLAFI